MPTAKSTASPAGVTTGPFSLPARQHCQQALERLLEHMPSVRFASIASVDGRSVAHANGQDIQTDAQRIAALISSLLGLIESLARETLGHSSRYSTIATEAGSLVVARIPSRSRLLTFCLCVDKSDNLALAIRATLDGAEKIAALVDSAG